MCLVWSMIRILSNDNYFSVSNVIELRPTKNVFFYKQNSISNLTNLSSMLKCPWYTFIITDVANTKVYFNTRFAQGCSNLPTTASSWLQISWVRCISTLQWSMVTDSALWVEPLSLWWKLKVFTVTPLPYFTVLLCVHISECKVYKREKHWSGSTAFTFPTLAYSATLKKSKNSYSH